MSTQVASLYATITADSSGLKRGLDQAKSELTKTGDELGKAGKGFGSFNLAAVGALAGVAVAAAAAAKGVWEFGKTGAEVFQMGESWDILTTKIGATPDLLEKLRKASRGTVDDMSLMSSTAALLAGTSDELGRALANASPQLMEIAKAANKVNPALGTTTYMYESLALGIKRSSPRILDNLGILVKVGEANAKYAASIGKSVTELTAEEKQIALLNETLEKGGNLIAQAGGNIDSATDSFARWETSIKNTKAALAELALPAIVGPVDALATTFQTAATEQTAWNKLMPIAGDKVSEYTDRVWKGESAVKLLAERQKELGKILSASGKEQAAWNQLLPIAGDKIDEYTNRVFAGESAVYLLGERQKELRRTIAVSNRELDRAGRSVKFYEKNTGTMALSVNSATEAISEEEKSVTSFSDVLKTARDDVEKVQIAQMLWGDEVKATNEPLLEQERAVLLNKLAFEEMDDATREMIQNDLDLIDTKLEVIGVVREFSSQIRNAADAAISAVPSMDTMFNSMDRDLGSPIKAFMDDLKYWEAGGGEIAQQFEAVKQAFIERKITPDEAEEWVKEIAVAHERTMVEAELETQRQAEQNLKTFFDNSTKAAQDALKNFDGDISTLTSSTRDLVFRIVVTGDTWIVNLLGGGAGGGTFSRQGRGGGGGGGQLGPGGKLLHATGGPVIPNTPYWVGEMGPELFVSNVTGKIVPTNQAGNMSGDTINIYNNSAGAAALTMAILAQQNRARLQRSMGR